MWDLGSVKSFTVLPAEQIIISSSLNIISATPLIIDKVKL